MVASKARYIWGKSTPIINQSEHPYLIKKQVQPHGSRLYGDALVIPLFNESQQVVNLQFIQPDGQKRFMSGGQKKSCLSTIGKHEEAKPILICEGWATGASLYEYTGHFVIVAMDAGNLEPVAQIIRAMSPESEIIIAGDNDESGKGQQSAREAALAIRGKYIIPPTLGNDWNDEFTGKVVAHG